MREKIRAAITDVLGPLNVAPKEKVGDKILRPQIAEALNSIGFRADLGDKQHSLKPDMPVWRSRDGNQLEFASSRRRLDIVVYDGDDVVGLVEIESDLDDIVAEGTSTRSRHYDVFSIARNSSGTWFDSYKSLERLAVAPAYFMYERLNGYYPSPSQGEAILQNTRSNGPCAHNPSFLPLFLVCGRCRPNDPTVLRARLDSLGAELHYASMN